MATRVLNQRFFSNSLWGLGHFLFIFYFIAKRDLRGGMSRTKGGNVYPKFHFVQRTNRMTTMTE